MPQYGLREFWLILAHSGSFFLIKGLGAKGIALDEADLGKESKLRAT
jgi:hypothetical protein